MSAFPAESPEPIRSAAFVDRHIGPDADETGRMLQTIGGLLAR